MDPAAVQQLISAALQEQAQGFQQTIDSLRNQVNGLQARPPSRPRPSLPDPDKFDGTFDHWETWYPEMKAKLDLDSDALGGTNKAKFWYVYGRLDKKPKELVSPQLTTANRDDTYDPDTLFTQLLRLCNNPNAKRDAEKRLLSLRQFPDQPFNTFLAAFERYLYRSGANAWPDATLIALLRKAVISPLKKKLDLKKIDDLPTGYNDFVSLIQSLESGVDYSSGQSGGNGQRKLWAAPKDAQGDTPMQLKRIEPLYPVESSDEE